MNKTSHYDTSIHKFKNKIFWTIFGIFTVMIVAFAGLFTYQTYRREVRRVSDIDIVAHPEDSDFSTKPPKGAETPPPKFMETMQENHLSVLELLAIAFIFEIVAAWLAYLLANYLTKPVAETFALQKQFIADASHELKTPLTVVTVNADLLRDQLPQDRHLKNILSESARMDNLIKQMLDLSATEEAARYDFKSGNLSDVIRDEVLVFDSVAYEGNLKITTDLDPEITFDFDASRIQQLVGILMDNAIHHAEPKSIIKVVLQRSKRHIVFSVRNRGLPIPDEDCERIFERFYRSDSSRHREQNRYGLGLAIAKNIVTAHHGMIIAHSAQGWTEFRVEF